MKNARIISVMLLLAFAVMLTLNGMANALPLNGYNTGELSDMYPNLFVPAGITFSIWGLIYLALFSLVIYSLVVSFSQDTDRQFIRLIGWPLVINFLANAGWIVAWHYRFELSSLVIMLILLRSLITMYQRLKIGMKTASRTEKIFVHFPISLYLGWITVATIANTTAVLVSFNWQGFGLGQSIWTMIMILIAAGLTLLFLIKRKDVIYSLVILWAFAGIFIKRWYADPVEWGILISLISGAVFIILAQIYTFIPKKQ